MFVIFDLRLFAFPLDSLQAIFVPARSSSGCSRFGSEHLDTFASVPDEKVLKQLYHLEAFFFNEDLVFDHRNAVVLEGAQASDPEAECSSEQRNVFDHSFLVRRHNNASFRSCQRVVGREAIVMLEADLAETCKTEIAIVVSEVLVFPRLGPNKDLEKHRGLSDVEKDERTLLLFLLT